MVKKAKLISRYCATCGRRIYRGGVKFKGYYYHKKCLGKAAGKR